MHHQHVLSIYHNHGSRLHRRIHVHFYLAISFSCNLIYVSAFALASFPFLNRSTCVVDCCSNVQYVLARLVIISALRCCDLRHLRPSKKHFPQPFCHGFSADCLLAFTAASFSTRTVCRAFSLLASRMVFLMLPTLTLSSSQLSFA